MSYNLYFYKKLSGGQDEKGFFRSIKQVLKKANPIKDDKDILEFLKKYKYFTHPEVCSDGFDAGYHNNRTGAEFYFNLHREAIDKGDDKKYDSYEGIGLVFTMNYCRPNYYVYEAMPIIEALCKRFDLYVMDPQDFEIGGTCVLKSCDAKNLMRSWEASNTKITKKLASEPGESLIGPDTSSFLPRDKTCAWWKYTVEKDTLSQKTTMENAGVFIPELKIFKRVEDGKLLLGMALAIHTGYLVPECDIFYIIRKNGAVGFANARELTSQISDLLKTYDYPGLNLRMLAQADAEKAVEIIEALKLEADDEYMDVAPGNFIDIDPGQGQSAGDASSRPSPASIKADIHFKKGVTLYHRDQFTEALKDLEKAVALDPGKKDVHELMGLSYMKMGNTGGAIEEFKKETEVNPDNEEAHNNLGNMYRENKMYDEAIAELKKAIELKPSYFNGWYNLGLVYALKEENDSALPYAKKAAELGPGSISAHNVLGLVYKKKGMIDESLDEYRKIIDLAPDEAGNHCFFGDELLAAGRKEDAIKEHQAAVRIAPNKAEYHYRLGMALHKSRPVNESITELQKAVDLEPGNPKYKEALKRSLELKVGLNELISGY